MLYNFETYSKSIRSNFTQERKRIYISPEEKLILSENISDELKENIIGFLLELFPPIPRDRGNNLNPEVPVGPRGFGIK